MIILQYSKRFQRRSLLVGDARSGHGQSRPSPDAGEWGSDGRAEWKWGPNVRTVQESRRCQPPSSLGTGFHAMRLGSSPFSRVESTPLPPTRAKDVGGQYLRIWRTLRRLQAAMQPCDTIRASASKEPAGVARESPPRDITVLGCCQMPLSRRIIGLVSLLQRCRRARVSAGVLGTTHEPTPMQTTLGLRRTMRITSASPQSYSFLDLT